MPEHRCEKCGAEFYTGLALRGHDEVFHGSNGGNGHRLFAPVTFRCGFCGKEFARRDPLREHLELSHEADREQRCRELEERAKLVQVDGRRRPRRRRTRAA